MAKSTCTTGNFSIVNMSYQVNSGKSSELTSSPPCEMDKQHYLSVFICESMRASSFQRFLASSIAQTSALLALLLVNNKLSSELSIVLQSLLTIVNSQARQQEPMGHFHTYSGSTQVVA